MGDPYAFRGRYRCDPPPRNHGPAERLNTREPIQERALDGQEARLIVAILDLTSTSFTNEQVEKARIRLGSQSSDSQMRGNSRTVSVSVASLFPVMCTGSTEPASSKKSVPVCAVAREG